MLLQFQKFFFQNIFPKYKTCIIGGRLVFPVLVVLLFLGASFWAKEQDPYVRKWFKLKAENGESFNCVAILPKPVHLGPVIIYAHGSGGSLMNDGNDLRQIAELGLTAVSLEYDQTNGTAFSLQFEALLQYLATQKWSNTNAIAWVGFSMGANQMWNFALQCPTRQPQVLVQLSSAGLSPSANIHCPVLLIHGDRDEVFPLEETKRLASELQSNGVAIDLKIVSDAPHDMEPDREAVFRCIGEYCLTHLVGKDAWRNYHSIAQRQAGAPPFWLFCIPAAAWAAGFFVRFQYCKPKPLEEIKLKRHEATLRWLVAILAIWALAVTIIHSLPPYLEVSDKTLAIARNYLVLPVERGDFEFLASLPIWRNQKLKILLEHAELANYNRELINWQLGNKMYDDYVLSPVVTGNPGEQLDWRRPLWEEFYSRIRHENSPEDAAKIIVRHLRERITIAEIPDPQRQIPEIWLHQITDKAGFEIIYVAALRSVGVPARLNGEFEAEFYDGLRWRVAPTPPVVSM